MRKTRVVISASAACLVAGLVLIRHSAVNNAPRPIRVAQTVLVAADGRRLTHFFDGLPPTPVASTPTSSTHQRSTCQTSGWLSRMLRRIELTV